MMLLLLWLKPSETHTFTHTSTYMWLRLQLFKLQTVSNLLYYSKNVQTLLQGGAWTTCDSYHGRLIFMQGQREKRGHLRTVMSDLRDYSDS